MVKQKRNDTQMDIAPCRRDEPRMKTCAQYLFLFNPPLGRFSLLSGMSNGYVHGYVCPLRVSEFEMYVRRKKKIICLSLQAIQLCIVGELAGQASLEVAVCISGMRQETRNMSPPPHDM